MNPVLRVVLLQKPRPTLDLDFVANWGYAKGQGPGPIANLLTISGGAGGTVVGPSGLIVSASAPRFDYDPVSLACKGLLIEEQRTNLLLNSLIDGTNLSTQTVTVAATPHTLSFYGAGTVTLSGASTAGPLVGSGAYPARSTLTFTPTAGSLTLTVSGDVKFAQLSPGSFATSYVPTGAAAVTRTRDDLEISGANFSAWCNQSDGTVCVEAIPLVVNSDQNTALTLAGAPPGNRMWAGRKVGGTAGNDELATYVQSGNVDQAWLRHAGAAAGGVAFRLAFAYRANDIASCANGGSVQTDLSAELPAMQRLYIGCSSPGNNILNGHIRRLRYWPRRLSNTELQELTR